ncbi:MAG: translocation/assembly module TamB domain-containing protein [Anaeromyxobacter sp.]|nr:translocation/assembly module TamB domain-containing protein [Anaeromyxobacter sp.]
MGLAVGRRLSRLLGALGWALLGLAALVGVALSAATAFSASAFGRPVVARLLVRQLDAAVAGRVVLTGFEVLPRGGLEIHGLEVYDPEGRLVLQVDHARLFPDLTRLRAREIGVVVELDRPAVLLETDADGTLSLARAFAPTKPAAVKPDELPAALVRPTWTLRLTRLTVRGADVWWQDAAGATAAEASSLDLDAAGSYGPAGGALDLKLRGAMAAPLEGPVALDLAASRDGDRLLLPLLRASLGDTAVEALAEADLSTLAFRAAVTRLGVSRAEVAQVAPRAGLGGDLSGTLYAESDGALLTAAADVRPTAAADGAAAPPPGAPGVAPAGAPTSGGSARAAVALRLPFKAAALGFDAVAVALDPRRLVAQAPEGRVDLTAHGAVTGLGGEAGLAGLRGQLDLAVAPSRLGQGELGPIEVRASADRGHYQVARLEARLPGFRLSGQARWQAPGPVSGAVTVDADDLARMGRNLSALGVPGVPALGGRALAEVTLSGSAAAPALRGSVKAPLVQVAGATLSGVDLSVEAAGPLSRARGRIGGRLDRAAFGQAALDRLELEAGLAGDEAALSLTAGLPVAGRSPVTLKAAALLAAGRDGAQLTELSLAWPGARYALLRPAQVTFQPAGVDRAELADGPHRLALSGGLGPKGSLDARLEVVRLDLARLPRGVLAPGLGVAGEVSLDARATGSTAAPVVVAQLAWSGGAAHGLDGLELQGDLGFDGGRQRASADLFLARNSGGELALTADLPVPFLPPGRTRREEPLALTLVASGWPVADLERAADSPAGGAQGAAGGGAPGSPAPVTWEGGSGPALKGTAGASLALAGTVGAPTLTAGLTLDDATVGDLGPFGLTAELVDPDGDARLTADATLERAPVLRLEAGLPLDVAALLAEPAATGRGLTRAPIVATLGVLGLELAAVSGRGGLPEGLAGLVRGTADLTGTLEAPRGRVALALARGTAGGQDDLAGELTLELGEDRTALVVAASVGGAPALTLTASLGAAAERLADGAAARRAPLALTATIPDLPLSALDGLEKALGGTLAGRLSVRGTPAVAEGELELSASQVTLDGRSLGELTVAARHAAGRTTAELGIRPTAGGSLWAGGTLEAPLGLDTDREDLLAAPATLKVTSTELDLGFLPALAQGVVRQASGRLTLEATAAGPLGALVPRGTVKLTDGRLAISEYGDWSGLYLDAALTDRALEVPRLEARRGGGRLTGSLSIRELGSGRAPVKAQVTFKEFAVSRAGMVFGTLDFPLELTGTLTPGLLDTTLTTTGGTLTLPAKTPRTLQTLERREDIVVGRPKVKGRTGAGGLLGAAGKPFEVVCHVLVPGRFFVKSDSPKMNLELKTDSTWRWVEGELRAEGPVEVVRGVVEPISGRVFHVDRGKVTFTGVGLMAAQVDAVARYDNPLAVVTVTVGGPISNPNVQLTSRPSMDDASIAMLIATGRTELKAGTSEIGSLTGAEVGMAAANAAVSVAFKSLVQDKLPLDSVSVDASTIRAGKYVTDKLFVGYTRRFEANPEKGENVDEVRLEYQVSPRWMLESRYGNGNSGGASLMWSKDY